MNAGGGSAATVADDAAAKGIQGGARSSSTADTLAIDSADDALHSNGSVTVNGGSITAASVTTASTPTSTL
ncbi:MAG: carbohydrate-binding domain-containing protein [Nakamurella sp.]